MPSTSKLSFPDMNGERLKLLSDGKEFYLQIDEVVFQMEMPIIRAIEIGYKQEQVTLQNMGDEKPVFLPSAMSFELSLQLVGTGAVAVSVGKDITVDFFNRFSIRDLLKEINKKIEKRG